MRSAQPVQSIDRGVNILSGRHAALGTGETCSHVGSTGRLSAVDVRSCGSWHHCLPVTPPAGAGASAHPCGWTASARRWNTQHSYAPIHYFNALCLSTNATDIASLHHRHRCPAPAHTYTAYPPIHLADLSRPPARQPSRPDLPIPQLLAPRRRHRPHLRPVLLSSRHARLQSEPPWGHEPLHGIINGCAPRVKRCVRGDYP